LKVKFTSRISQEAKQKLKMEALKLQISIEEFLSFLILNGRYPDVEDCRKIKE